VARTRRAEEKAALFTPGCHNRLLGFGSADRGYSQGERGRSGSGLNLRQKHTSKRRGFGIKEDSCAFDARRKFLEQLDPLCPHASLFKPEAGNVPPGLRKAREEALADRVGNAEL
jgi:hypothetical protein